MFEVHLKASRSPIRMKPKPNCNGEYYALRLFYHFPADQIDEIAAWMGMNAVVEGLKSRGVIRVGKG